MLNGISSSLLKFLLTCFFLLSFFQSESQNRKVVFGEVTLEELEMKTYLGDSTAPAIVLYDFGYSGPDSRKRHKRIKILNKSGYRWADVEVRVFKGIRLRSLKAATYNAEGGTIVKTNLDNKLFYKEEFNDFLDVIKFAFPNVKETSRRAA